MVLREALLWDVIFLQRQLTVIAISKFSAPSHKPTCLAVSVSIAAHGPKTTTDIPSLRAHDGRLWGLCATERYL